MKTKLKFIYKVCSTLSLIFLLFSCTACHNGEIIKFYESVVNFEVYKDTVNNSYNFFTIDDQGRNLNYLSNDVERFDYVGLPGDSFRITYTGEILGVPVYPPIFEITGELLTQSCNSASYENFTYKLVNGKHTFIPEDDKFIFEYTNDEFYFYNNSVFHFDFLVNDAKLIGRYSPLLDTRNSDGTIKHTISCFVLI